ncbi:hypothetical protein Tco_0116450 [Tanacetum coccineum]
MMKGTKSNIEKFDEKNNFALWQVRMKALLEQQGLAARGDTLKLEDVLETLNSRELQKMTEAKGDGGEGLYVRRRSGQRDTEQGTYSEWSKSQGRSSRLRCYISQSEEHLKRDCPRYNHKKFQGFVRNEDQVSDSGADGYDNADVLLSRSVEELLDWIMDSGGSYHITYNRDYLVDFEEYDGGNILTGKVQVQMMDGSSFVLDNVRYVPELRRNLISLGTLEKEGFTMKMQSGKIKCPGNTLKGKKQLGEYQTRWKIRRSGLSKVFWAEDTTRSTYLVNRSPSSAIGFKTPIGLLDKIYAHESLTFNNTVAYEVISKWKAGLKDDMDARSNVYVLSNGCKKCSDDSDGYYWESKPFGSQEYQMVCTRLDIASADVGMLDKFDRGLQTDVQVFVDFDYAMAAYMTLTEAAKEAIWLKRLAIESGFELKIVAGIAIGALSKAIPSSRLKGVSSFAKPHGVYNFPAALLVRGSSQSHITCDIKTTKINPTGTISRENLSQKYSDFFPPATWRRDNVVKF